MTELLEAEFSFHALTQSPAWLVPTQVFASLGELPATGVPLETRGSFFLFLMGNLCRHVTKLLSEFDPNG